MLQQQQQQQAVCWFEGTDSLGSLACFFIMYVPRAQATAITGVAGAARWWQQQRQKWQQQQQWQWQCQWQWQWQQQQQK
jgi:hypothetical protein